MDEWVPFPCVRDREDRHVATFDTVFSDRGNPAKCRQEYVIRRYRLFRSRYASWKCLQQSRLLIEVFATRLSSMDSSKVLALTTYKAMLDMVLHIEARFLRHGLDACTCAKRQKRSNDVDF